MVRLYGNNTENRHAKFCVSFVYAHGELEGILGHDILVATSNLKLPNGITAVEVEGNDRKVYHCVAFVWDRHGYEKGLVVLSTDVASYLQAYEAMNAKKACI